MIFSKIKDSFSNKFNSIFGKNKELDEMIEELEETLILSDVGAPVAIELCERVKKIVKEQNNKSPENIKNVLRCEMIKMLEIDDSFETPNCILVVGVNGVGKTTTIAKLSNKYKSENKKVLLVAGDTFRAGAVEQLKVWADRIGVRCISGVEGADPSSVMFDGSKEYVNNDYDILICDTAGRLHNKKYLMDELDKMKRTITKNISENDVKVYMVLDSTTGQNGVMQARKFYETTNIDGIILTKLDSTAKGGVVFSIINELKIPIKYIGIGEKIEDIRKFNAEEFVESIL